jgi:hypothetical protein
MLNRIGSGTCDRETPFLFTPYQNTIGSGTCGRKTPFLSTPPFHQIIKKLLAPVRVTEKHRFSSPRSSTIPSKNYVLHSSNNTTDIILQKKSFSNDYA